MRRAQTRDGAAELTGDCDEVGEVDDPLGLDLGAKVVGQLADAEEFADEDGHPSSMARAGVSAKSFDREL